MTILVTAVGLCLLYLSVSSPPIGHDGLLTEQPATPSKARLSDVSLANGRSTDTAEKKLADSLLSTSPQPVEATNFRTAVYGNPYKALHDAKSLPPAQRDTIFLYVRERCSWVARKIREKGKQNGNSAIADPTGEMSQALIALESQCRPVFQDVNLQDITQQALLRLAQWPDDAVVSGASGLSVKEAPLTSWAGALFVEPNRYKDGGQPKYFFGSLWAGLDGPEQYNRAVQQALFNLTVSSVGEGQHLESLIHCADTGACGIPAHLVAVHDLPADVQARVLAVARAMQREIAARNSSPFAAPARP